MFTIKDLPFFDTTITILNRYEEKDENGKVIFSEFIPTIISNCFLSKSRSFTLSENTVIFDNSYVCKIPKSDLYIEKALYFEAIDNGVVCFTLDAGDVIIGGAVESISGMQYSQVQDLLKSNRFGTAFKINTFQDFSKFEDFIPHYKVMG